MKKYEIPIKGMHCKSCEMILEEKLGAIPQVDRVKVNLKRKTAEIVAKSKVPANLVRDAIEGAGYEIGKEEPKKWLTGNPADFRDLGIALLVLIAIYFIAKSLGFTSLSVGSGRPSSLAVVLLVGLTAGISSCMALVGGLVLSISARYAEKHPEATTIQKFRPHLFFNIGRILSYFILGGVIGLIGKAFQFSGPSLGALTIFVGIVMLVLGLQLTEISPKFSGQQITLPPFIAKLFGIKKHTQKEYSHSGSALAGALTFFLPCGFTQAMQLYAMSTGRLLSGALIMGVFALGTTPGLLGVGGLTSFIKGNFAKKFFKFAGLLVIALAFFNFRNGWNLTGWKISSGASDQAQTSATLDQSSTPQESGPQIIKMTQSAYGYQPNRFTVKKGVPVKWVIDSVDSNSCAASIYAPKIGVRKFLDPGENTIEFTPKDSGEIRFSCSMGMYTGTFIVK